MSLQNFLVYNLFRTFSGHALHRPTVLQRSSVFGQSYPLLQQSSASYPLLRQYSSCSPWKLPKDCDVEQFYHANLRSPLCQCYQRMTKPFHVRDRFYFVGQSDFVNAAARYPLGFRQEFWEEVVDKRVIVEDSDSLIYPDWFRGRGFVRESLRRPIGIICPMLPPPSWDLFYTDASPRDDNVSLGGGGIVWVTSAGVVTPLSVRIAAATPFISEGYVLTAAACFARSMHIQRAMFVSDCLDLVDAFNGRGYIQQLGDTMFRDVINATSEFKERVLLHMPREGVALADYIANEVKWQTDPEGYVQCFNDHSPKLTHLGSKLSRRVPLLRFDLFRPAELVNKSEAQISHMKKMSPLRY